MFRKRSDGGLRKRSFGRPANKVLKANVRAKIDDDNDDIVTVASFDDADTLYSSSSRDSRVQRRARQILKEEAEAQKLAAALRRPYNDDDDRGVGRRRDCNRNRNCCWNDTTWMRPMCITPLYTTPIYPPAQTFVSSSVDTVCSMGGGCYTVTQPIATTCTPFGCASVSIAPPNLAAVRDVAYYGTGAVCSMF